MPHIREVTEVRFFAPEDVPADAAVLDDIATARWRAYYTNKRRTNIGNRPGWLGTYDPTDLRTVAARVYASYCECDGCRDWRDRGRPRGE